MSDGESESIDKTYETIGANGQRVIHIDPNRFRAATDSCK